MAKKKRRKKREEKIDNEVERIYKKLEKELEQKLGRKLTPNERAFLFFRAMSEAGLNVNFVEVNAS